MLLLKTLKWSNCYSYGPNNEIDLSSEKLMQILGDNGAGKSSIPLILEEVLFNKNSKGLLKGDIANRQLDGGYSISLDFEKDGDEYTIATSRKTTTLKAALTKNGKDISSHTTTSTFETLEKILGLDFKIFPQLTYQSMYSGLSFLTDSDASRKTFLTNLLNLSVYAEISEKVKILSKEVLGQQKVLTGNLQAVANQIKSLENQDLNEVEIPTAINVDVENKFQIQKELENTRANIKRNNLEISKNQSLINTRDQLAASIDYSIFQTPIHDVSKDLEELKSKQAEEAVLKAKVQQFTKAPRGKCPTCGSPFDSSEADEHLHEANKSIVPISERIKQLTSTINSAKSMQDKVKAEEAKVEKLEMYKDISTASGEILDTSDLDNQIAEITKDIKNVQAQAESINRQINAAISHNAKVESYKTQLEEARSRIESVQRDAEKSAQTAGNLEILTKAYGSTGLVTHKLHLLTEEISNAANEYLDVVSLGRFVLQFKIAGEKLNVAIFDNGMECSIKALSSGEQARVNISTLLAVRKVASDIGRINLNVLFIDEMLNTLDPEGRDTLIEVLLQEENLNCFIVSHGWSHPLVGKIQVVKEGEISKIYGN